jgi:predicted ArsR family transcriptional regulator
MQLTRQQIIDYLKTNRVATPLELSHALLVTTANIRYHLGLLKRAGIVEVVGQEPARGRGRPTRLFGLTENAHEHNLEGLASALLKSLFIKPIDADAIIFQTASQLLGEYSITRGTHARLNEAVEKLNQMKYRAAWEASPRGPRIIFRNCPFAVILSEHPELCRLDEALLNLMLDQPVKQTAKLHKSPDGSSHCTFIICPKIQ